MDITIHWKAVGQYVTILPRLQFWKIYPFWTWRERINTNLNSHSSVELGWKENLLSLITTLVIVVRKGCYDFPLGI